MTPFFLDSRMEPLFAVYWPPAGSTLTHAVLHVPAFAEEMNKSRRMAALQARAMAKQGYAVLVLDLFGTGDSSGDFSEATWAIWLQNIADAVAWLKKQGARDITLWGLRLGALLAMDFANQHDDLIDRLMVWQPVLNGDTFIAQFLRLRVAAAMMNAQASHEKTSELKRQLINGHPIEVAGYTLNPDLIRPLAALRAAQLNLQGLKAMAVIEVVAAEDGSVSVAGQQFFDTQREQGVLVSLSTVVGESFWASQEIVTSPNLITLTSEKTRTWL